MARGTKKPNRGTCWHEAGHGVAALVQGLAVNEVSVVPGEDYRGSCVHPSLMMYSVQSEAERRRLARRCIIASYAGLAAERLVDPTAPDWHGAQDEENAFETSRDYGVLPRGASHVGDARHLALLARLRAEAATLVNRNRGKIERLAEALRTGGTLTGPEAAAVVGLAPS